jgi:hypothetical protein
MKMAKASHKDMEVTMQMLAYLESIANYGQFRPDNPDANDAVWEEFDDTKPDHLLRFYEAMKGFYDRSYGGLFRVVYGYATAASNNAFDPNLAHLEFNPALWGNTDPNKPTDFNWLVEKVCRELPEGYLIQINMERGSGDVSLLLPGFGEIPGHEDETKLDSQIFNLLKKATGED